MEPPDKGVAFAVPLADGRWRLGCIAQWYCADGVKNTPLIVLFDQCDAVTSRLMDCQKKPVPVGMMFTIGAKMMYGLWPLIGEMDISYLPAELAIREAISKEFTGIIVHNEPIVEDFSNAFEGLVAWNKYKDPLYFDKLLAPGVARPARVYFIE